jgi:hypothetical protein
MNMIPEGYMRKIHRVGECNYPDINMKGLRKPSKTSVRIAVAARESDLLPLSLVMILLNLSLLQ